MLEHYPSGQLSARSILRQIDLRFFIAAVWLLIMMPQKGFTQQFGGNPPSLKWQQVNTDAARIIFPDGLEKQAQEIARTVNELAERSLQTIGTKTKKINIVLQNQTIASNGYVGLGPFRSEFYMTPRQNNFELGSLPWGQSLALHEYRHVQQFNNFRKGLSKGFYYLFGEQGQGLANSLAVPDWFFEGDAVHQETMFSMQGRGKLPWFFNPFQSLWTSGKNYPWMKLRNGSYRDLVPDHYRLGYLLVDYGRKEFGPELWREVTQDAAAFRGLFYPFQKAVFKHTGISYKQFTSQALTYYRQNAIDNLSSGDTAAAYGSRHDHFVADNEFPQWLDDSTIVYVKTTYKKIPAFVSRNIITGVEKVIAVKHISPDEYFSYRNGKIVYTSLKPDARWGWRNYGALVILDTKTGEQKTITKKSKYFSPDISRNGKIVMASSFLPSGKSTLHLINGVSGELLHEMPNPDSLIITQTKFYGDTLSGFYGSDSAVSAVRNIRGEMAVVRFDLASGRYTMLTPFSMRVVGWPQVHHDTVYFTMAYEGRDQLFAVHHNRTFRFLPEWENSSTGNYHLSGRGGTYTWTMFTSAGLHTVHGRGKFEPVSFPADGAPETSQSKTDAVAAYPVEKYAQLTRPFNFHSWRPIITDPEYSYSLIGENILNTLRTDLFFTYNRNERFKQTGASMLFGAWYPIIQASGSYTIDRSFTDSSTTVNWNELNASAGVSIPLRFTKGVHTTSLNTALSLNRRQVTYTGAYRGLIDDKNFNFADAGISFVNQMVRSRQQIHPSFAQSISLRHRFILNRYTAYQFGAAGAFYFPGFSANHSLVLQAHWQHRDTLQEYNFPNTFAVSRGYRNLNFPRMWRGGINYHFPMLYPDAGFSNIVYLLRIRGNVFYDHTRVQSLRNATSFNFRSTGMEIYFDSNWWNQLPVTVGLRYSRLFDAKLTALSPNQWELVLPLTLLSDRSHERSSVFH